MVEGLTLKEDEAGRITVEYLDVLTLDLSRAMQRLFDKAFGAAYERPQNVIPFRKETPDEPT